MPPIVLIQVHRMTLHMTLNTGRSKVPHIVYYIVLLVFQLRYTTFSQFCLFLTYTHAQPI